MPLMTMPQQHIQTTLENMGCEVQKVLLEAKHKHSFQRGSITF